MARAGGDVPVCSRSAWQDDWRGGLAGASESRASSVTHKDEDSWNLIRVEGL